MKNLAIVLMCLGIAALAVCVEVLVNLSHEYHLPAIVGMMASALVIWLGYEWKKIEE